MIKVKKYRSTKEQRQERRKEKTKLIMDFIYKEAENDNLVDINLTNG